jgi:hypothetical protein
MAETVADTRRLITKPQNLNDAYGPPSNFLEIDVSNPQTVGVGRGRFTTYEIRVKVRRLSPFGRNPLVATAAQAWTSRSPAGQPGGGQGSRSVAPSSGWAGVPLDRRAWVERRRPFQQRAGNDI